MRNPSIRRFAFAVMVAQTLTGSAFAHSPAEEMSEAAQNFLAALTPEQKAKAVYEWKSEERFDWHYVPKARKGLPFKEMTPPQRPLANALLASGLSQRGYAKAATIMSLEQILYDLEHQSPTRDPELYYVTVFGTPAQGAWGWRVEGHHLSLNFTIQGDEVLSVTPSFFGDNPARIETGPRQGLRVLGAEEDLARKLVKSLNAEQRKAAIISADAPQEIITGNARKANPLEPLGLSTATFSQDQKDMVLALLKEYLFRYRTEIAESDLKKIRDAGEDKLFFAWAGGLEPGQGHYYRLQGPSFLMEYDNTQNNANHIHTVWREFKNDFGEDLLRQHYDEVPHSK
jgi:hypothetical protein